MSTDLGMKSVDSASVVPTPENVEEQLKAAHAPIAPECVPKPNEDEVPPKKRRTRRGKRRQPYLKNRKGKSGAAVKVIKPEAPHNSNQFLIEDHGDPEEIAESLRNDPALGRTRDSSFSVDSDVEIGGYSSPEDGETFLQKDFDDTYENFKVERLSMLTKSQLIEEFLQLEKRHESKCRARCAAQTETELLFYKREHVRINTELDELKRENRRLRYKLVAGCDSESGSVDSESDSSSTCSSCTSKISVAKDVDYTQTNGHSPAEIT